MSVTRPTQCTEKAIVKPFAVTGTVRRGFPVKLSGGNVVECTAVTDACIGISRDTGDATGVTGLKTIGVYLHDGIVPVLVGTGGATKGSPARLSASGDGLTTATIGGGTGAIFVAGTFEDDGVVGDFIGLSLNPNYTVGS